MATANTLRVLAQIDPDIPVADFCRALAACGYSIKANADSPMFYITRSHSPMVYEPIPYARGMGWSCYDRNQYDGPESPMGTGATKEDALADYEEQVGIRHAFATRTEL